MERCKICYNELGYYDRKYCCQSCAKIAHDTKARVYHQNLKYQALIGGGKQRHKRFEEEVMSKICVDCGEEHSRPKTERCFDCAKKRQNEQTKQHMKKKRGTYQRKPCRHCGCELGPEIPTQSRYCSDECKAEHNGVSVEEISPIPSKEKKAIDPKFLTRGKIRYDLGSSSMGSI